MQGIFLYRKVAHARTEFTRPFFSSALKAAWETLQIAQRQTPESANRTLGAQLRKLHNRVMPRRAEVPDVPSRIGRLGTRLGPRPSRDSRTSLVRLVPMHTSADIGLEIRGPVGR